MHRPVVGTRQRDLASVRAYPQKWIFVHNTRRNNSAQKELGERGCWLLLTHVEVECSVHQWDRRWVWSRVRVRRRRAWARPFAHAIVFRSRNDFAYHSTRVVQGTPLRRSVLELQLLAVVVGSTRDLTRGEGGSIVKEPVLVGVGVVAGSTFVLIPCDRIGVVHQIMPTTFRQFKRNVQLRNLG